MTKYLVETEYEDYRSEDGHRLRRENRAVSPNGNRLHLKWVLRDKDMRYVDHDTYRHDIMARHGFSTTTLTLQEYLQRMLA